MSGPFNFGIATPQPQQQQQQQPTSLFGAPMASSTPTFGIGNVSAAPSLFGSTLTSTNLTGGNTGFFQNQLMTSQPQLQPLPQTGFSLGGSLGTSIASAPGGGFSFGTPIAASVPATTAVAQSVTLGGTHIGGLGGIPAGPRVSTLALGNDPGTGWSTRNENRAVQELPVPPEIIAIVEELKNQMKNHKSKMMEVTRTCDLDIESVAEQIEEVRMGITTLVNVMHKQELQSASLINDMQELSKDIDLLSQAKDVPAYGFGATSAALHTFLFELIQKYSARMLKYKVEIERAEFSLQTIVGAYNVNAKDLWASLAATKDSVILLAAQIQQLHEEVRTELNVHKNISQVLYASSPKPWLSSALSGNEEVKQSAPPLERVLSTPSKPASAAPSLETMYQRTYSMLDRVPSLTDSRALLAPTSEGLMRPSSSNIELTASLLGSYIGTSSPASLKRSKK